MEWRHPVCYQPLLSQRVSGVSGALSVQMLKDNGDSLKGLEAGLPPLFSLQPQSILIANRPRCQLPLLGKKTGQVRDQETTALGKTLSQISVRPWRNFLPEPIAKRSSDASWALTSCASLFPLGPSRPQPTASKAGPQGAWQGAGLPSQGLLQAAHSLKELHP